MADAAAAAGVGVVFAQVELACRYAQGLGVDIDLNRAALLMQAAAGQGDAEAQCILGTWSFEGSVVSRDPVEALRLWQAAAQGGDSTSLEWLQMTGLTRLSPDAPEASRLMAGMSAWKNDKDPAAARAMWLPLAESGNADAQYLLALCSFEVAESDVEADWVAWSSITNPLRAAAAQGHPEAICQMCWWLSVSTETQPVSWDELLQWCLLASDGMCGRDTQKTLAAVYSQGPAYLVDYVQAYKWAWLAVHAPAEESDNGDLDELAEFGAALTPGELAEAERLALDWLAQHPQPTATH